MKVEIDNASGFCHGVVSAIRKAEERLGEGGVLYCLGDIVHNSNEVERLQQRGLKTITHSDLENLRGQRVLLRAHGEPPSTYAIAKEKEIEIIDATCPVVLQLQRRIKAAYDSRKSSLQIVIYGKTGHAEVNGLVGQTNGEAIVVENVDGLDQIDFSKPVSLYSQTTKSTDGFRAIAMEIKKRLLPGVEFNYYDTICRQVANRVPQLKAFAASHELLLFVSGKKSSNGKILFGECVNVNPCTHLIAGPQEIDPQWLAGISSVGICGATSTPRWLMEQVRDKVLLIHSSNL
ncbi:MAG: 4-hydroxy-3-methylbut-2-enyl diphosphate reductase [Muribaculum sp.]|nr:4-hydroxy-3-methylbut-2-enyl diphosphate reductase [Muribaculum sp.]